MALQIRRTKRKRRMVLAMVLAAAIPIGMAGMAIAGFLSMGDPGGALREAPAPAPDVTAAACVALITVLEQPVGSRVDAVRTGTAAIRELIAIVSARDDVAVEWIADWEQLAGQREEFAEALERGLPPAFEEPRASDGLPISGRMIDTAPNECRLAVQLAIRP